MIIHAARNAYPKEFIGLLGSRMENDCIDELILTHSVYGDSMSSIYMESKPIDRNIVAQCIAILRIQMNLRMRISIVFQNLEKYI